jgi:basic membrane protein A
MNQKRCGVRRARAVMGACTALATVIALSACGSSSSSSSLAASSTGSASSAATSADASSAAGGCGFAYVFEDPISSSTAEQTIERGLKQAEKDFRVKIDIIDGSGLSSVADNLRAAASKGCYRAIGTAFFDDAPAVTQVAKQFPSQHFYIEAGGASGANVTNYTEAAQQGTYVAGAMAAAMSKSRVIGIIDGDNSPPLRLWAAGYTAGAHATSPSVKVLVNVTNSFTNPALTGQVAVTQASQGADIIYPAAGSNLQVYALGKAHRYQTVASDLTDYASAKTSSPPIAFIAASAEGNVNYAIIKQLITGHGPGQTALGLTDHAFYIPCITDPCVQQYPLPAAVIAAGKKAYENVVSGKVTVPTS